MIFGTLNWLDFVKLTMKTQINDAKGSCRLLSKLTLSKMSFRNPIRVSKVLDPGQNGQFVGPDLVSNCS